MTTERDDTPTGFPTVDQLVVAKPARLIVLTGSAFGRSFAVEDEVTIGRQHDCTVALDEPGISRVHARLVAAGSQYVIQDLQSRNGTLLNGTPIRRASVNFGDRIQLGAQCVLLFTYRDAAEEHLEHLRRMETVGRLTAGIAHDFNNLLMVMVTSFEHLGALPLDEVLPKADAGATVADGMAAVEQAVALTRRILMLSRPSDGGRGFVHLKAVVEEVGRLCQRIMGSKVDLEVHADPAIVVWGNASELQSVLMNLCVNARDAMPDGGRLWIRARRTASLPGLPVGEDRAVIEVVDTGVGMTDETRRRVFDPFFTTKEGDRGTGLGLATSFAAVQRHGGTFHVSSEPGRGTTFSIFLPLAPPKPKASSSPPKHSGEEHVYERVLVVDDEALVLRSTARQLRRLGCSTKTFSDADEAVAFLRRNDFQADLAVLDLHLGTTTAIELIPRLSEIQPQLPVLVFSGHWTQEEADRLHELGVSCLLQKPCSADELRNAIQSLPRAAPIE